jgi:hypothetical protein
MTITVLSDLHFQVGGCICAYRTNARRDLVSLVDDGTIVDAVHLEYGLYWPRVVRVIEVGTGTR